MMPYNPMLYMPQNYQPVYQPQYQPNLQATQMSSANPQMMTPPTIHAEIVQVDGEQAAASYPVGAGTSQMMIAKDESAIYVKSATPNGFTLDVFEKRVKSTQNAVFNPEDYITKAEAKTLVEAILTQYGADKHGKREETDE